MSLKGKLARFKNDLVTESKADVNNQTRTEVPEAGAAKWEELQAKPFMFDGQTAWVRTISYPLDTKHGRYSFSDLKEVVSAWNETNWDHPLSAKGLSSEDLLFFDTETTGLGGGVGNTIFLIGCGYLLEDRVVIKQFFLPSPSDEVALYQAFLSDVKDLKNLVTYNGKAFDWPQIKTRHTFLREAVPKLPAFGHFDLLHASRRLWKDTLESNRLAVVERDILKFRRTGDTPGHLVPIYYFEYVKQKDPEIVRGVLEHNEYDILSLITLYTHLSQLILSRIPISVKEQYEIGRWYAYIGAENKALECFLAISNAESRESVLANRNIAAIYKRQKRFDEAMMIWEKLLEASASGDPDILIEMAKVFEHHYKDFKRAMNCSKRAYRLEKQNSRTVRRSMNNSDLEKRINRLERKLTCS
ncbi:MAG TPA: ribonuclease H-like domain-containing protein [Bacillales bacterium]|nr:ribonuclease H-like domain-containing protein [Bacillales bacterium]